MVRASKGWPETMLFMSVSQPTAQAGLSVAGRLGEAYGERTLRELQNERDRQLAAGRLRLAAELTTWVDELMAESGGMRYRTAQSARR
jgi:hypothetical protein